MAACPKITVVTDGPDDGPRIVRGLRIDDQPYYVPAGSAINISASDVDAVTVSITLFAREIEFVHDA